MLQKRKFTEIYLCVFFHAASQRLQNVFCETANVLYRANITVKLINKSYYKKCALARFVMCGIANQYRHRRKSLQNQIPFWNVCVFDCTVMKQRPINILHQLKTLQPFIVSVCYSFLTFKQEKGL